MWMWPRQSSSSYRCVLGGDGGMGGWGGGSISHYHAHTEHTPTLSHSHTLPLSISQSRPLPQRTRPWSTLPHSHTLTLSRSPSPPQNTSLDGHKLVLQLSKRRAPGASGSGAEPGSAAGVPGAKPEGGGQQGSTKLVVRNVAFEATKKDIQVCGA